MVRLSPLTHVYTRSNPKEKPLSVRSPCAPQTSPNSFCMHIINTISISTCGLWNTSKPNLNYEKSPNIFNANTTCAVAESNIASDSLHWATQMLSLQKPCAVFELYLHNYKNKLQQNWPNILVYKTYLETCGLILFSEKTK